MDDHKKSSHQCISYNFVEIIDGFGSYFGYIKIWIYLLLWNVYKYMFCWVFFIQAIHQNIQSSSKTYILSLLWPKRQKKRSKTKINSFLLTLVIGLLLGLLYYTIFNLWPLVLFPCCFDNRLEILSFGYINLSSYRNVSLPYWRVWRNERVEVLV